MELSEILGWMPALSAGIYFLFLLTFWLRRGQQTPTGRWLAGFLGMAALWQLLTFFWRPLFVPPNLPNIPLLFATLCLAKASSYYVESSSKGWVRAGILSILFIFLLEIIFPRPLLSLPLAIRQTTGGLISSLLIVGSNLFLLTQSWWAYRQTQFSGHANRLLFWFLLLLFWLSGLIFSWLNPPIFSVLGQGVGWLAAVGMVYALLTHRLFDLRHRLQQGFSWLVTAIFTALPLAGIFLFLLIFVQFLPPVVIALIILFFAAAGSFWYQPLRHFIQKRLARYLPTQQFNTHSAVRGYGQAVARVLDVEQLSLIIVGTLSELLETNRGALFLLTSTSDYYELEPIPAMGRLSRQSIQFLHSSLLLQTLANNHYPLSQYELDFNPEFQAVGQAERVWLKEQEMEVYAPVFINNELSAIIALGPKSSGLTYHSAELELIVLLADQTGVALQNARLYRQINQQNEKVRHLNDDLQKQNERLAVMDKVKSDFITIASHELRTPLTQVKGYADILAAMNQTNSLSREQTQEIVGYINRATQQLEKVISAMLDASQLDVKGMQLSFMSTGVETILRLAIDPLRGALQERQLTLLQEGVDKLPSLQADFKRLVQAFQNIIGNAIKYTPDRGTITIKGMMALAVPGLGEFVEIVVVDTGIGIEAQYHELIFEKFFRIGDPKLHSTGNTKFKGAGPGLGLPIAKGVIEAHGGRIWVESPGCDEIHLPGTEVHIVLPVMLAQAAEQLSKKQERPPWLVG